MKEIFPFLHEISSLYFHNDLRKGMGRNEAFPEKFPD
jgi:hypothetical protein